MLTRNEMKKNIEVSKLLEYAYDLHEKELERSYYYCEDYDFPSYEFYNGYSCPVAKINGGIVLGFRGYANHSDPTIHTTLGVCIGKNDNDGFNLEFASFFSTTNKHNFFEGSKLKIINHEGKENLEYDHSSNWTRMTYEDKKDLFIKTMQYVGFKKEDIISVINGTLTAKEAYMNVAPDEIKNLDWISIQRRMFKFDGNVAIEGSFDSIDMDRFPFPFEGQPILDCAKVKTACIHFETNKRKVKLINVNSNPESIIYTDLRNAIIEEPINLSLVDATGTKFGHHTVINLEYSKASLDRVDLHLAVNENGERYVVDENGIVKFDYDDNPETISLSESEQKNILVLANADNEQMTKDAVENDADGIGLVRTEHIFKSKEDVQKMIELLNYPSDEIEKENLKRIKELQTNQIKEILINSSNQPIAFRLLDFKLKEYLRNYGLTVDDYYDEEYVEYLRGAAILCENKNVLTTQVEAIFEIFDGTDKDVNLIIPMLRTSYEFTDIKEKIIKLSKKYNLKSLQIGAMIENIEMSNDADELAKEADFISIGTNDLTESVTGLSRDSNSSEFQELTNEVKSVIKETIYRARSTNPNIVIGICGEHSNYVKNLPYYSTLDINYITCSPSFVMSNKKFLSNNCNIEKGNVISDRGLLEIFEIKV